MDVEVIVGAEESVLVLSDVVVLELSSADKRLERDMRAKGARRVRKRIWKDSKECIKLDKQTEIPGENDERFW